MKVVFAFEGDEAAPTGGHIYNRQVRQYLSRHGINTLSLTLSPKGTLANQLSIETEEVRRAMPDILVIDSLGGSTRKDWIYSLKSELPSLPLLFLNHLPGCASWGETTYDLSLEQEAMAACDAVVVTGQWARELLITYYNQQPSQLIIPGLNFQFDREYKQVAHQFFAAGSVSARKGYHVLLEALGDFRTLHWELQVAGDTTVSPTYFAALKERIQQLGLEDKIHWLGSLTVQQMAEKLKGCDIFISPSLSESYGMAADEAVLNKVPSILTQIPPYKYRFHSSPVEWVHSENKDEMARIIGKHLLSDKEYISWTETLRRWVPKRTSWEDTGKKWVELLERLVNTKKWI